MRAVLLLLMSSPVALAAPVPKLKVPVIDLRTPDGKVLLADKDLESYDWDTHTIAMPKEANRRFRKAVALGATFTVCVDAKPVYEVTHMSVFLSRSFDGPVIISPSGEEPSNTTLRIHAAYPGDEFAKAGDKRNVKELKAALAKAGKLKGGK